MIALQVYLQQGQTGLDDQISCSVSLAIFIKNCHLKRLLLTSQEFIFKWRNAFLSTGSVESFKTDTCFVIDSTHHWAVIV